MTLDEAKKEMVKFVELKTTLRPAFVDVILNAEEVKHGHWTDNGHIGKRRWCSLCGGIAFEQYDDYGLAEVTESDYCPHCGARMEV